MFNVFLSFYVSVSDCIVEIIEIDDQIKTKIKEEELVTSISGISEAHKSLEELKNYFLNI